MYCPNCGNELGPEAVVCGVCGYDVKNDTMPQANSILETNGNCIIQKKSRRRPLILITAAVLIVAVLGGVILVVRSNTQERRLQKQLDLGYKYLAEMDYEQAIASFNAAIDIDPRNDKAYAGLIDVYVAVGDKDQVGKVLEQAAAFLQEDTIAKLQIQAGAGFEVQPEETSVNLDEEKVAEQMVNRKASSEDMDEIVQQNDQEATQEELSRTQRFDRDDGGYWIDEYDENGNRIKMTMYEVDGTVGWWATFELDEKGGQVKQTTYNSDGTVKETYEFDEAGNTIKDTLYKTDGTILYWNEFEYDAYGKRIKGTLHDGDGTVLDTYQYNETGNIINDSYNNVDGTAIE